MKLSNAQIAAARDVCNASPLPADHPVAPTLEQAFGSHTFYLREDGLSVFLHPSEMDSGDGAPKLVRLAVWTDSERNQLAAVEPVNLEITLPTDEPDDAA